MLVRLVVVVELGCNTGTYMQWKSLNNSQNSSLESLIAPFILYPQIPKTAFYLSRPVRQKTPDMASASSVSGTSVKNLPEERKMMMKIILGPK